MASDDDSAPRAPVVLRIKLRYDDLETMVQRFAPNVGRSGLFLPTRAMQPAGTEVKFELRLANDVPVLVGLGRVKHARPPDLDRPKASFGLAIELMRVTRDSREVIIRMIERRRALGLPDVGIPLPDDTDAARRAEVESAPRAETSGIVREAMAQLASAPVSEQVLTPRRDSGPIAVAKQDSRPTVTPLAPEPAKPRRPRVGELIAKASEPSGPLAALPELDDARVDLSKVIARARALAQASGAEDLDAELAALRDSSAAPLELSVEAASAELARQLGGASVVKRERSARWEPPPAIVAKSEPAAEPVPAAEPAAASAITAPDELSTDPSAPPPASAEPARPPGDDDQDLASFERALDAAIVRTGITQAAPPRAESEDDDDLEDELDDAEQLDSLDLEPADEFAERTQIGGSPIDPVTFVGSPYGSDPAAPGELADRLDEQLAAAEAEADSDFAIALQPQPAGYAPYSEPAPPPAGVFDDDEPSEEISDLDVLAVADADDADLLGADGEADAGHDVPAPQPGSYDFAARLDLGDDDAGRDELDERRPYHARAAEAVPRAATYDPPSGGYTIAESSPSDPDEFDEPHAFSQRTPQPAPMYLHETPPADQSLESALEALEPDLDDLSPQTNTGSRPVRLPGLPEPRGPRKPTEMPIAAPARARQPTPAMPQPRRPLTEDDGVLIDFDDDD